MRRTSIAAAAFALVAAMTMYAHAANSPPGVSATEVAIGATFPFSGPASAFSGSGKGLMAYVRYVNDNGGVNGRKINLTALDDAYSPPKTVEQTRRLVERDEVAFIYSSLGTATNSATVKYLNNAKVPQVFIQSGASKFMNAAGFPYTTIGAPSYEAEGRAYARYITDNFPNANIAVLYQNDDLGRDYLAGLRSHLGSSFASKVFATPYEVLDPTVDSQVVNLMNTKAEVFVAAASPKFAAQAIRRVHNLGWQPQIILSQVASSIATTLQPAGLDISKGVISSSWIKDLTDPKYKDDPVVDWYKRFSAKYLPGVDIADFQHVAGVNQGMLLEALLKQCGDDLSRQNVNRQSHDIRNLSLPLLTPGITITTSATNNQVYTQFQMQRFNGVTYETFGEPISVAP